MSMSHPLLGDVSCRATCHTIEQLRRLGLPTNRLTVGLPHSLEDLTKPSNSIPWDDFLRFADNSREGLTAEQIVEICVSYKSSPALRPLLTAAGIWFNPARYYSWICDSESGAIRQLFRCISAKFSQVGIREVTLELIVQPGFSLPPDFFWETQAIAYGALTTYFGLPSSLVTWEKTDRGALLHVSLPRKRPFRYFLSWIGSFFRKESAQDLRNAIKYGNERSVRLEIEIIERKKAEDALLESDRRFQQVTDSIPGVVYRYVMNPEGRDLVTHISAGIRELTGHTPAEVIEDIGKLWNAIHPDDIAGFQDSMAASASGRKPWSREYRLVARDRSIRWVRSLATAEASDGSGTIVWNGILLDVTAERMASEALKESETRWKFALQGSGAGVLEFEIETGKMFYSDQWRRMTGYGPDMLSDDVDALKAIIHPEDLAVAVAALEETIAGKQTKLQVEHRIRRADGKWIWIEARGLVTSRGEGAVGRRLTGTYTDISERRLIEQKLRANDSLLKKLTRQVPGMIFQFQRWPDGRSCIPYASEGIRDIYELAPDEVKHSADKIFQLTHPDDAERFDESIRESERTLEPWHCYCRIVHPIKGLRWVEGDSVPERMPDGSTIWHGHCSDVTDRKIAEDALRESQERLYAVIRNAPNVAIQWFDSDCRVELWNEASETLFGYSAEQAIGRTLEELILTPEQDAVFRDSIAFVRRTGQAVGPTEFAFHRLNGREGVCLSSVFKIPGDGVRERFVCMDVDITDRKEAEAALRQSTKRLALAVGATSDAIWEWNYLTGETYYSLRWYEMLGHDSSLPMTFDTWKSICHPDDFDLAMRRIRATIDEPNSGGYEVEFRMRHGKGHWVWIQGRGDVVERDRDGNPRLIAGTNSDITERKQNEEAIRASEARLNEAQRIGRVGSWEMNAITGEVWCSDMMFELFGVEASGMPHHFEAFVSLVHPEDMEVCVGRMQAVISGQSDEFLNEFRVVRPDGRTIWLTSRGLASRDATGMVCHIRGTDHDITDRKSAEDSLRSKEKRLRSLISALAEGVTFQDPEGKILDCNVNAEQILGLTRDQILGRKSIDPLWRCIHVDGTPFPGMDHPSMVTLRTGLPCSEVIMGVRKPDETLTWISINAEPLVGENDQQLQGVICSFSDITARKSTEDALRESEARLRLALSAARASAFVWNVERDEVIRYQDIDRSLTANLDKPDSINMVRGRVHPDDLAGFDRNLEICLRGEADYRNLYRLVRPGQPIVWLEQAGFLERNPDGTPRRLTGVSINVTERKNAESALFESEARLRVALSAAATIAFVWDARSDRVIRYFSSDPTLPANPDHPETVADVRARVHPEDREQFDSNVLACLEQGNEYRNLYRILRADGSVAWLEEWGTLERDANDRPISLTGISIDVTARIRAEQEIRESEIRYRKLIETSSDGIFILGLDGRILSANSAAARMHGYSVEELLRMRMQQLDLPDAASKLPERMKRLRDGEYLNFEVTHIRKDGTTFPVEVVASAVEIGGEWLVLAYDRDITERRRAEAALRDSEHRQRIALDAGRMGTWEWEVGSDHLDWNESEEQLFGFARGEFDGRYQSFLERVHEDDREAIVESLKKTERGEGYEGEFRVRLPSGEIRWISASGAVVPPTEHSNRRLIGINYDITERKTAEQTLIEEKSLLQAFFSSLPGIVFAFDQTGKYVRWNHNYETLLGWSDAEMAGMTALDTVVPRDREKVAGVIRDVFEKGESATELLAIAKDGREIPLYCSGVRRILGGKPCVIGFGIDISARLAAEQALRLSEFRLLQAQTIASLGYWEADLETGHIWWSDEEYRIFGRSPDTFIPTVENFLELIHPEDRESHEVTLREFMRAGGMQSCRFRICRPDGAIRHVYEEARMEFREGVAPFLRGVTKDVTEQAVAELAIRASLREKEVMLKEIHHRVKNNLQVISSLLSLQAARVSNPVARDVLVESQNRVRAMALVHESLYRSDDLAQVNLSRYIGELCGYLFRGYGVDSSRIRLELDIDAVTIPLDKTIPCGLIVNEMISNSLKYAFPKNRSGTIIVTLRAANGVINLTLADDGIGIPADLDVAQSPSLGLQLVNILTDQLGGTLEWDRSAGARMMISFSP